MKFKALQENLRKELWSRIEDRDLTGMKLADQIGVQQAHISNFLNRKRGLSLEAMDRVLGAQRISVLDLLDPNEVNKRASILPPSGDEFENVLLVEPAVAANEALIRNEQVRDILKFKKGFLKRLKASLRGAARQNWRRFVLMKVDAREGMSMYPRLLPGATVLIDRHYNTLTPYRRNEANMYAIARRCSCTVKYVELVERNLVLRPHNQAYPIEVLPIEEGSDYSSYLVGRVCHVAIEA